MKTMATLEDSFLADLDELSDHESELDQNDGDAGKEEEDIEMDMADLETLKYHDDHLDCVSKLLKTQRYADIIQKVEEALGKDSDEAEEKQTSVLEDDPEYKLIVDCNQLLVDIENEIVTVHNFIRHKYRFKFQELESLVHDPTDYASVVKRIGNETDLTLVDLKDLLRPDIVMVVSVTASTTKGNPLQEDILQKTLEACDRVLDLDSARKKVLEFVKSKMGSIAPNLSVIVGSGVAAKLMGSAGGLSALGKMPANNVQLLGYKRKNLAGFSTATWSRVGYLEQTEIFKSTPPRLGTRVIKLLASKSSLAARVDATRGDPSGTNGKALREEIDKKIEKWQEPPPARKVKPLPIPDFEPKKRRGGRRLRKRKDRYQMTDMRILANRMPFCTPEAGSKKLRIQSKLELKLEERQYTGDATTCGLKSSLAFTPVQGIVLCNPQTLGLGNGTQSTYFSESGTFSKLKKI